MAKIYTVQDDFNDNSLDTNKWTLTVNGSATGAEQNQRMEFTLPSSMGTGDSAILSADNGPFDLTSSEVFIRNITIYNSTTDGRAAFIVYKSSGGITDDAFWFIHQFPGFYAYKYVGGTLTSTWLSLYSQPDYRYIKIRESGGVVYWDISADKISWTNKYSSSIAFSMTSMEVQVKLFAVDADTGPVTYHFDEFNTPYTSDITKNADYEVLPTQVSVSSQYTTIATFDVTISSSYAVATDTTITKSLTYGVTSTQRNIFNTGWLYPNRASTDSSIGTRAWTEPDEILKDDTGFAYDASYSDSWSTRKKTIKLLVDGVVTGNNNGTVADDYPFTVTDYTFGSNIDGWGLNLTPTQVNGAEFGVAVSLGLYNSGVYNSETNYLIGKSYDTSIPTRDTYIIGIEAKLSYLLEGLGGGLRRTDVYDLAIRVSFLQELTFESLNHQSGYARFNEEVEKPIDYTKSYQYLSYKDGVFISQINDVISKPTVTSAVNSLPSDFSFEIARTIQSKPEIVTTIETTGYVEGELLADNYDQEIYAVEEVAQSLGAGTDIDVYNDIIVNEYYGGFENLVDENGEDILSPDLSPILIPMGYPQGRIFYTGYVTDFNLSYSGASSTVQVHLYHHSAELNNELYKSSGSLQITSYDDTSTTTNQPFGGWTYFGDIQQVAQSFTTVGAFTLGSIKAKISGTVGNNITCTIRSGTITGDIVATASAKILGSEITKMVFAFPSPVALAPTTAYFVIFSSSIIKSRAEEVHPARLYTGTTLASAQAYYYTTSWQTWTGWDYSIEVYSYGGQTKIAHNSYDPSDILKAVLDYNLDIGGVVNYTDGIEDTGTLVTASFNTTTIKEAIDYVLKLSPSSWYWYIPPNSWTLQYRQKPTVPAHTFTLGKDIVDFKVEKSISHLVNMVYFIGGYDNPFVSDTFDDTAGKYLADHSTNNNLTWVKHSASNSAHVMKISTENRVYMEGGSGIEGFYYVDKPALSNDYSVLSEFYQKSYTTEVGVIGRFNLDTNNCYLAQYATSDGNWALYKRVSGTWTSLGTAAMPNPGNGSTTKVELKMVGSNIKVIVNGSTVIEVNNSAVPTGLYGGIRQSVGVSDTTGFHHDNFSMTSDLSSKTNVFKRTVDSDSILTYRKGMKKIADNRVTDDTSINILSQSEIDTYKNPVFTGTVKILRDKHPELVEAGQLVSMAGFDNYIDTLTFQVMRVQLTPELYDIELGVLLPRVSKRVEDLKRNLDLADQHNNPDEPA